MAARKDKTVSIMRIETTSVTYHILGTTPLVLNRPSEKTKRELLLPKRTVNKAGREQTLKHDPLQEYRDSVYRDQTASGPTRIVFPAAAFRRGIADAALDIPGAAKSVIGRLTSVPETYIPIFGIPVLFMAVVRSADVKKTPDIRTRAAIADWATQVTIRYVDNIIKEADISNLFGAAGVIVGIGDGRVQRGALSFGQFEIVSHDDPRFLARVHQGQRAAQDAALDTPDFFDAESEDLYTWFVEEVARRQKEPPSIKRAPKGDGRSLEGRA